jgi:hypothetical protein
MDIGLLGISEPRAKELVALAAEMDCKLYELMNAVDFDEALYLAYVRGGYDSCKLVNHN